MTQMKSALAGIPLRRAMLTHFRTLSPANTLGDAVDLLLTGSQQDFPVVANGRIEGILTRSDLVKALTRSGRSATVADAMKRDCPDGGGIGNARDGAGAVAGPGLPYGAGSREWRARRARNHGQCRRVPDDSGGGKERLGDTMDAKTQRRGRFHQLSDEPGRRHHRGCQERSGGHRGAD